MQALLIKLPIFKKRMKDEYFNKIKEKYDNFQRFLLENGRLPAMDTKIGYWGVTPLPELYELFKRINLGQYKNFIDIGSGDGRVVLLASIFGIEAHGIEYDQWLSNTSIFIKRRLDLPHFRKTRLLHDNFMDHDLSRYNIIFTNPDKPFFRDEFESKLLKELNGQLIVHGWEFHPQHLRKKENHIINGEKFVLYTK